MRSFLGDINEPPPPLFENLYKFPSHSPASAAEYLMDVDRDGGAERVRRATMQVESRIDGSSVQWGEFQGTWCRGSQDGDGQDKQLLHGWWTDDRWEAFRDTDSKEIDTQVAERSQAAGQWWCEDSMLLCNGPTHLSRNKKPKYVEEDGLTLHGYECIVFYIALDCLQGVGLREKSLIQLWLRFVEKEVVPLLYVWVYPIIGLLPYYEQATERAKVTFKKVMSVLETHLRTRTYMIGERLSIADVTIVSALVLPYMLVFDPIFRKPYISVNRWFTTCVNNTAFVEALGNVALCEETRHYEGMCSLH
ncbi:elongation factor 1-gamma [Pelobates cultripes]|uniref:Elongation factor 1-gamma n=1 Tax=Pelobates cultripes TaxID=61616 RepID=A0AAD1SX13_PELCU|nr:elongation factor 1-gamma [Pelobates cultripes]